VRTSATTTVGRESSQFCRAISGSESTAPRSYRNRRTGTWCTRPQSHAKLVPNSSDSSMRRNPRDSLMVLRRASVEQRCPSVNQPYYRISQVLRPRHCERSAATSGRRLLRRCAPRNDMNRGCMSLRAKRGNLFPIVVELAKCGTTMVAGLSLPPRRL